MMAAPQVEPPHGTRQRYQLRRDPCRCVKCKLSNTEWMRGYRARKRGAHYQPMIPIELRMWPSEEPAA